MALVRRFYAHEGVVPPHGPREEQEKITRVQGRKAAVGFPDSSWLVKDIDAFAFQEGIDFPQGAKKDQKLEILAQALADAIDQQSADDSDDSGNPDDPDDVEGSGNPDSGDDSDLEIVPDSVPEIDAGDTSEED